MKYFHIYFLFVFLLISSSNVFGQWTKTNGPYLGLIHHFYIDSSTVYAAAYANGLYKSTDGGVSWHFLQQPNLTYCDWIAGIDSELFVSGSNGLYHSTDGGNSFNQINDSTISNSFIGCVAVIDSIVFTGTSSGLLRSTDDGVSWNVVGADSISGEVSNIESNGKDFFAETSIQNFYKSTDRGVTWARVYISSQPLKIYSFSVKGAEIFASGYSISSPIGVYLSTDNGNTWTTVDNGLNDDSFNYMCTSKDNIMGINGSRHVYFSTNNGSSWNKANLDSTIEYTDSFQGSSNYAFLGTDGSGVYRSTDGGLNWNYSSNGIDAGTVYSIVSSGQFIFACALGGVFKSSDNGNTWQKFNNGIPTSQINNLEIDSMEIFALTQDQGVFKINIDSTAWKQIFYMQNVGVNCMSIEKSMMLIGTTAGIFLSTNNGTTWDSVNTGLPTFNYSMPIQAVLIDGTNFYAGTYENGVYKSTDNGTTWFAVNNGLPLQNKNIYSSILSKSGNVLFAGTLFGLYKSTDNGVNWSSSLNPNSILSFLSYNNNLFAGTSGRIYVSRDTGNTWEEIDQGYDGIHVYGLGVNNDYLFAGSDVNGVWKRPLSEIITSVKNLKQNIPNHFFLEQNYPNPFNPTTKINYNIAKAGIVKLTVYNLLGQRVSDLINKYQTAGEHSINFNPKNLTSGVYFYQLREGNKVQTKKMVLLK